jgi:uncharacterized membrane protein (DUF485 family)
VNEKPNFRPLIVSLFVNIVLPALAIQVLTHAGVTLLYAIVAGGVFPLADLALSIRKRGRADAIAVLSLVILIGSAIIALFGNDPRYALVRDSALTSIAGLFFLASLLRPRPIMYELSREAMPGATKELWEERWAHRPVFRRTMRVLTIAWGVGLLLDSLARVLLALVLAPAVTVIVSPLVAVAVFGGLMVLTVVYIRAVRRSATLLHANP